MIFAQYKYAITFALAIMALAVVVADPGSDDADQPVAPEAAVAQPAPQDRPDPAIAAADPEWYGAPVDGAEPAMPADDETSAEVPGNDASYNGAPAAANPRTSRPAAAPAPVAQAGTYVAPPPPPQNFQP
ncbi:MAG: hypothetical protein V4647_08685 [Pseudomonadota bacterium]